MAFDVQWQDPSDMTSFKLLEPGEATFVIKKANEHDAKGKALSSRNTGEAMVKFDLYVTDAKGVSSFVSEYVVASQAYKVKNICWSIGKPDIYMDGRDMGVNVQRMVRGTGKCIVKTDVSENPQYGDKTVIAKFIDAQNMPAKNSKANVPQTLTEDSLPF